MAGIRDLFFVKLLSRPAEAFAEIRAGGAGWGRPLAACLAAAVSSSFLLSRVPPEFLADAAGGARLAAGRGFWFYLAVCLPGAAGFSLFFCALMSAFTLFLKAGRFHRRLPALITGTAAYGFSFLLPHKAFPACAAALAALFAAGAAWAHRRFYAPLLKAVLALSALTLVADLAGFAAVLAGSTRAYSAAQYFFAFVTLVYLTAAGAVIFETTAARAAAALVAALAGTAAFLYSLLTLGLLGPEVFQTLLLV